MNNLVFFYGVTRENDILSEKIVSFSVMGITNANLLLVRMSIHGDVT